MKYFGIIVLILSGCQNRNAEDINNNRDNHNAPTVNDDTIDNKRNNDFLDSLYTCDCEQFISKLEETPSKDTNAYRITITSKKGNWKKSKLINTRPGMSHISYCTELYTVVSFACGGPCHSEVFVFTTEDRKDEQYDYVQQVKNNPSFIVHIKNEKFGKLILHNLRNNRELTVDISDSGWYNYGIMDSIIMKKNNIVFYYMSKNDIYKTKTINIKSML